MGVEYSAIAVLGIKIDLDVIPKIKKTVKKPAFKHDYSEKDTFHPKTGKKLWTDETMEIDSDYRKYILCDEEGYEDEPDGIYEQYFRKDGDEDNEIAIKCLCKFKDGIECEGKLCYVWEEDGYVHGTFIGLTVDNTGSNGGDATDFKSVPEGIKEKIKNFLEPYGLWDEKKYGLYTILYCSY